MKIVSPPLFRALVCVAALVIAACTPSTITDATTAVQGELASYVRLQDNSYGWRVRSSGKVGKTDYVELILTSQRWRNILWRHQLYIIRPSSLAPGTKNALLVISGGNWKPEMAGSTPINELPDNAELFAGIAELLKTPVVVLRQVPFEPMFGGLREDDLIALSFDRYLNSGETDWPLLLPMVKSAVRAMDAVQDYARRYWGLDIETFTVTGSSKRGWTTWLTAAVDRRVTAIIPIVIDVLDMDRQMDHAKAVWGEHSEELKPYSDRNILDRLHTPEGQQLLSIVDPYNYLESLQQPKLIINATNDAYWPLDALNLYWNDLQGPKYVIYVPNNGHNVKDYGRMIGGIAAMQEHMAKGIPFPEVHWRFKENPNSLTLALLAEPAPTRVVAWTTSSPTRDFRKASWQSSDMNKQGDKFVIDLPRPDKGFAAVFGEVFYKHLFTAPLYLSTNVRIVDSSKILPDTEALSPKP